LKAELEFHISQDVLSGNRKNSKI